MSDQPFMNIRLTTGPVVVKMPGSADVERAQGYAADAAASASAAASSQTDAAASEAGAATSATNANNAKNQAGVFSAAAALSETNAANSASAAAGSATAAAGSATAAAGSATAAAGSATAASASESGAAASAANATSRADEAEAAQIAAEAALDDTIAAIATSSRFGLPGISIDFEADTHIVIGNDAVTRGASMDLITFTRASSTVDVSAGGFVSFASGVPVLTDKGLGIWRASTNTLDYGQDMTNAAWEKFGLSAAAGPDRGLGVSSSDLTLDASTGQHRIRRVGLSYETGKTYVLQGVFEVIGAIEQFGIALGGTPFPSNAVPYVDSTTGQVTIHNDPATITYWGAENLFGDVWLVFVGDAPDNTGTGSVNAYAWMDSPTFEANGAQFRMISLGLSEGTSPTMPILTPGTGDVSRAGDLVLLDGLTGPNHTIAGRFRSGQMRHPTGVRLYLRNGNDSVQVRQRSDGVLIARSVVASVIINEVELTSPSSDDVIAFSYSETTQAFRCWINGIEQDGFIGGPTSSLTQLYIGSNPSASFQFGGYVSWVEALKGLTTKGVTGTGGAETIAASAIDRVRCYMETDSADGAYLYVPMPTSADGLDFVRQHLRYGVNVPDNAEGLKHDAPYHVRRTGELTFGAPIQQLGDDDPACDDSTITLAAQAIHPSAYNAIVINTNSQHGQCVQEYAQLLLGGKPVTPGSMIFGDLFEFHQRMSFKTFDGLATEWAKRTHRFRYIGGGREVRGGLDITASETIAEESYAFMNSSNNPIGFYTKLVCPSGELLLTDPRDTIFEETGPQPWMEAQNDDYFARMGIVAAYFNGVRLKARIDGRNTTGSSALFKLYADIFPADLPVVAGDRVEWEGYYQWGLIA